jgi:hypothetical protein
VPVCSQDSAQSGTPDCPVVHRTLSGAPGWSPVNWPLSGKLRRCTTIIHRTVQWANGRQINGRSLNPRATRGPLQRSAGGTRVSGVHRTVSGAPTSPKLQWSAAPGMEGNRASDMNNWCPVVHRTVRCATRQKARLAFYWGPLASEGPQKRNLTMFSKRNMWTGTFKVRLRVYKSMVKTKLNWDDNHDEG